MKLLEQQLQHLTARLTQTASWLGAVETAPEMAASTLPPIALSADDEAAAPAGRSAQPHAVENNQDQYGVDNCAKEEKCAGCRGYERSCFYPVLLYRK